jgi:hypothetical protein
MAQKGDGQSLDNLKDNKVVVDQQIHVARSELKNLRFGRSDFFNNFDIFIASFVTFQAANSVAGPCPQEGDGEN